MLTLVLVVAGSWVHASGVRIQACGVISAKDSSHSVFDGVPGTGYSMRVDCNGDKRVDSTEKATIQFMSLATPGVSNQVRSSAARKGHINHLTKDLIKRGKRNAAPYLCMHMYATANPCDSTNNSAIVNGVYKMCSRSQFRSLAEEARLAPDEVIPKVSLKPRVLRQSENSDICHFESEIKTDK